MTVLRLAGIGNWLALTLADSATSVPATPQEPSGRPLLGLVLGALAMLRRRTEVDTDGIGGFAASLLPRSGGRKWSWWTPALALTLSAAAPLGAQTGFGPLGPEFLVNTYTSGAQSRPAVTQDGAGGFVVVWQSRNFAAGGYQYDIQAQRFASDGRPSGRQFQVNATTTAGLGNPSVSRDGGQGFVVVWQQNGNPDSGTPFSIQARRFASNGTPQGAQFQVNPPGTSSQGAYPSVGQDGSRGFVVAWASNGSSGTDTSNTSIQARRYASNGTAQGAPFQVNTLTTGYQYAPAVSPSGSGGFVVVWGNYVSDIETADTVQGQRFASDGRRLGQEFKVNSDTPDFRPQPAVSLDGGQGFVVTWQGSDGFNERVHLQRYASDGRRLGNDVELDPQFCCPMESPSVSPDGLGGFVISFEVGFTSVYLQRLKSDGRPEGQRFQAHSSDAPSRDGAVTSPVGSSGFVVVWRSFDRSGADTENSSIHARRFGPVAATPVPVTARAPGGAPAVGLGLLVALGLLARRRGTARSALGQCRHTATKRRSRSWLSPDGRLGVLIWATGFNRWSGWTRSCSGGSADSHPGDLGVKEELQSSNCRLREWRCRCARPEPSR